jgi:hypothetical protein
MLHVLFLQPSYSVRHLTQYETSLENKFDNKLNYEPKWCNEIYLPPYTLPTSYPPHKSLYRNYHSRLKGGYTKLYLNNKSPK